MSLLRIAALVTVFLVGLSQATAQMPAPPISGFVVSGQHGPVAGVTVSLVHPAMGRSSPAFTGVGGGYYFTNIPPRTDPYYIEAYWGNQLLFRGQLYYQGSPVRFDIPLP